MRQSWNLRICSEGEKHRLGWRVFFTVYVLVSHPISIYSYSTLYHMEARPLKPDSVLLFPSPSFIINSLSQERLNLWLPSQMERNIPFWKLVLINEIHTSEFSRRQKNYERQLKKETKCINPLKIYSHMWKWVRFIKQDACCDKCAAQKVSWLSC